MRWYRLPGFKCLQLISQKPEKHTRPFRIVTTTEHKKSVLLYCRHVCCFLRMSIIQLLLSLEKNSKSKIAQWRFITTVASSRDSAQHILTSHYISICSAALFYCTTLSAKLESHKISFIQFSHLFCKALMALIVRLNGGKRTYTLT